MFKCERITVPMVSYVSPFSPLFLRSKISKDCCKETTQGGVLRAGGYGSVTSRWSNAVSQSMGVGPDSW